MARISSPRTSSHAIATGGIGKKATQIATTILASALLLTGFGAHADTTAPANADGNANTAKTERCLLVSRIRKTTVVDDQTVLFYMPQNVIYKNVLPNKCNLLGSYKSVFYKPTGNELCSLDTIGALITDQPSMSRANCGLGTFELVDKATADKLISDAKAK